MDAKTLRKTYLGLRKELEPNDIIILFELISELPKGKEETISSPKLAKAIGIPLRSLQRRIKILIEKGFLAQKVSAKLAPSLRQTDNFFVTKVRPKYTLSVCYDKILDGIKSKQAGRKVSAKLAPSLRQKTKKSELSLVDETPRLNLQVSKFIAAYIDAYRAHPKYGNTPPVGGVYAGCARNVVKQYGLDKAIKLMHAYLNMGDSWFCRNHHDLKAFQGNLAKIMTFEERGKFMTGQEAQMIDRTSSNEQVLSEVLQEIRIRNQTCSL